MRDGKSSVTPWPELRAAGAQFFLRYFVFRAPNFTKNVEKSFCVTAFEGEFSQILQKLSRKYGRTYARRVSMREI